ncbi:K(+)-transporting ATPase subunit F [Staphylococcus aureus]|nr:K(+)-transporting ATPase subunit F [Staphylococcus aureus]
MLLCCKDFMSMLIVLLLVVIALFLYLFYALIRSEKFYKYIN